MFIGTIFFPTNLLLEKPAPAEILHQEMEEKIASDGWFFDLLEEWDDLQFGKNKPTVEEFLSSVEEGVIDNIYTQDVADRVRKAILQN